MSVFCPFLMFWKFFLSRFFLFLFPWQVFSSQVFFPSTNVFSKATNRSMKKTQPNNILLSKQKCFGNREEKKNRSLSKWWRNYLEFPKFRLRTHGRQEKNFYLFFLVSNQKKIFFFVIACVKVCSKTVLHRSLNSNKYSPFFLQDY